MIAQMRFRWPTELVVDLFAGGGGASTGIEAALGAPVDLAINHWEVAIRMHEVNHPHTAHLRSDVFDVHPVEVTGDTPIGLLWASPDCTFFSKARGAAPIREKGRKIRSLAWVVVRWAKLKRPRVIMLENVEEFRDWGPLGPDGKLVASKRGQTFRRWARELERLGYVVEHRELVAADYGAPTTRRRLFVIARCDGGPIVWPEATHRPGAARAWRTAAEIIDWKIPCPSIFARPRPLAEATLRRIARGIQRYVIDTGNPFIVPITTAHRGQLALVTAFLARHWGGMTGARLDDRPFPTVCSKGCQDQLVQVALDAPGRWPTREAQVRAFLVKYFATAIGQPLTEPAHTVTGKARFGLVTVAGEEYRIVDIGMRMLSPRELYRAQGFPDDYRIDVDLPRAVGAAEANPRRITKTDQIKLCGNSVSPPVARALVEANVRAAA